MNKDKLKCFILDVMGIFLLILIPFSNDFGVQMMYFGIALFAFISSHQMALQITLKELLKKEEK